MMTDTEDYLELESILDSCIVDDGKRWYNVKWKTAWLSLDRLPEEALKDYHCINKKDKAPHHEKIYSILEEKIDYDGLMKYLLCSINTWEPEEKLARLYPVLLNSYWSENTNSEEIFQTSVNGCDSGSLLFRKTDTTKESNSQDPNCNNDGDERNDEHSNANFRLRIKLMSKASSGEMKDDDYVPIDEEKVNKESEEKQFKCLDCGKEFLRSNSLKMHMRTHTGEKPYECTECGKHFSQRGTLTVHMRSHTGEKPFKCWYCDSEFSCHHYLKCHLSTHTGEKAHKCEHCGKTFSQKGTLTVHIRTHTGEKPYKCVVCAKQFSSQQYLKLHMTTHSDEKPFHCNVCLKQFVRSDSLKLHMRTHNDSKPFKCKLCEKQFKSNHYLKMHEATHSTEKAFACDECGKEFSQKGSLMRHLKIHQKEDAKAESEYSGSNMPMVFTHQG